MPRQNWKYKITSDIRSAEVLSFLFMLREQSTKPVAGDFARRWMEDDYFDLIVWYEPDGNFYGFQLCYDKPGKERALTWTHKQGFTHTGIDSGEQMPTANRTPVLVPDSIFPAAFVKEQFLSRSVQVEETIRELVSAKINEFESTHKDSTAKR